MMKEAVMKPLPPDIQEIGEKCAWCLTPFTQPYMICVKLPTGYPIKADAIFLPVELKKAKRFVHAVVMQPGSPGKREGYDLMFGLCSEECTTYLKNAIEEEATGMELMN